MENILKVNPACKLKSLSANLSMSNDLVDRIKVARTEDEE